MTQALLTSLLTQGNERRYSKNQIVEFSDSEVFYLLQKGYVKRYLITKEGEMGVQSIYVAGQFFPLTPVFLRLLNFKLSDPDDKTYLYQAMTEVQLRVIKVDELYDACINDPFLYRDILYEAGRRLRSNIHQLDNQSLRTARWRLAHELVFLANDYGEQVNGGIRITIPLTHRDIANMLNMSRETVSRVMVRLQEEGYLIPAKDLIVASVDDLRMIYA